MTPKRLPNTEFMPYAPQNVGEEVNVNHEECEAGLDRKRRLYVKRVEGGVVAYCHHCGKAGYFMYGKSRMRWPKHVVVESPKSSEPYLYSALGSVPLTTQNITWLHKYVGGRTVNVQAAVYKDLREANDVDGKPIIYPIYNPAGAMQGWQLRWVDGRLPKTKTYLNVKPCKGAWYGPCTVIPSLLIIVEDPLSATIISAEMGTKCRVLCLLGTKVTPEILTTIMSHGFTRIVVWMDPDEAGRTASAEVGRRLQFAMPSTEVHELRHDYQPKETRDIPELLERYV